MKIKIKKEWKSARMPTFGSEHAAGADLYAAEALVIARGDWAVVGTGFSMEIPPGIEAQIRPRSGLALKEGVSVLNTPGTIDADYRGLVGVILVNHGPKAFIVNVGDRIAQMVIQQVCPVQYVEAKELGGTERGEGGFGSTGT